MDEASLDIYETVVETTRDGIYVLGPEGDYLEVNTAFAEMLGYEREEVVGTNIRDYVPEAHREEALAEIERGRELLKRLYREGLESTLVETVFYHREGHRIPCEVSLSLLPHDDEYRGAACVVRDVTERKEREETLEQYRALVESAGDPMWAIDTEGTIQILNQAMADFYGRSREEVVGKPVSEFARNEAVLERGEEAVRAILSEDDREWVTYDEWLLDAEGNEHLYEVTGGVITDGDEEYVGSVAVFRDISDRHEKYQRKTEELRKYQKLVESAGDPMWVLDADGSVAVLNEAMAAFHGADKADLVGRNAADLLGEEAAEKGRSAIRSLLARDDPGWETIETWLTDQEGTERLYETTVGVILDDEGEFDGSVATLRDITERQRKLRRKTEQLDNFASMVSHDLRNPLNVASGYLDLAEEDGDPADFDAARDALRRMDEMIDELLTFARAGGDVDDLEPVTVDALATTCWAAVDTGDATLRIECDDETVAVDRGRFRHVFENLFRNANEHNDAPVEIRVGAETDDGRVTRLYVVDDGRGIPPEQREDVFEYGETTSEDGTGLGLAIVSTIVDAHGWEIDVTDGEDDGTRFEIRLS